MVDILTSSGNVTLTLFLVLPLIPICPYLSVYFLPRSLSLSPPMSFLQHHNILQLSLHHSILGLAFSYFVASTSHLSLVLQLCIVGEADFYISLPLSPKDHYQKEVMLSCLIVC